MAHVTVNIGGRQFRMACEDGQEEHLTGLVDELNRRIAAMRTEFGEIGDQRLLVMAALKTCDELAEAKKRVGELEREVEKLQDDRMLAADRSQAGNAAMVAALNAAAERVEQVTRSLNQGFGASVAMG